MKQNTIKDLLNKIEKDEKTVEKIGKFITTRRGKLFVKELHTAPFLELCKRHDVPKFVRSKNNSTINYNFIKAAIKELGLQLSTEIKTTRQKAPKQPKTALCMTSEELKSYNKAHNPRKMGLAALMHAYEEHKMRKFEKKHPAPTEKELAEDLFPEELKHAWTTMMNIHREYVRDMLSNIYYKNMPPFYKKRDDYFKLYIVYDKSESEGDPYVVGYPFTNTKEWNQHTSVDKVKEKLQIKANYYCADSNAIGLRVYNKYGIPIAYSTIPRKNFET